MKPSQLYNRLFWINFSMKTCIDKTEINNLHNKNHENFEVSFSFLTFVAFKLPFMATSLGKICPRSLAFMNHVTKLCN